MKAILSEAPGGPQTLALRDIPVPEPKEGEVRIAVRAVGVNYPDVLIIEDRYQYRPERPFSPGTELSGVVEAVGPGVKGVAEGERVLAMTGWGAMAEKVVAPARRCVRLPENMPFDEAAAFLMTYGTSWHALRGRADLRPGETVLVLGAAGGVGLAAVELGKAIGARVVAAASTQEKVDLAIAHGAVAGHVYPAGPLDRDAQKALSVAFKELCGEGGANVVYDPVGGDYSEPALRAIAWLGRYLVVGFPAGIQKLPANLFLLKNCDVRGVNWGGSVDRDPVGYRRETEELLFLYGKGSVKPTVSQTFPLEKAGEAITALAERRATGKVVVTVE